MSSSRKENERTKLIQEKCQTLLTQMLRDEDNKYCVDCDAKGPRWASWNLGVFLCIRCAGIHRNLGVHISRVKSVNLDTWTPEQVISLQQMGNSRARAVYEAQLPDGFRRPQTDNALESFIRAKYEHKKYVAREWVPPSPPKVDWAKEIDEEIEKQKRKKKSPAQAGSVLGIGTINSDKKLSLSTVKTPLPAPLPKPKTSSSPKTNRIINPPPSSLLSSSSSSAGGNQSQPSNDLLGLNSPTIPTNATTGSSKGNGNGASNLLNLQNDTFSGFLSATPNSNSKITTALNNSLDNNSQQQQVPQDGVTSSAGSGIPPKSSLAKDEEDFFNQTSLANDKDKSGKLSMDRILALYATPPPPPPPTNQQQQFMNNQLFANNFSTSQQQPQQYSSTLMINPSPGGSTIAAAGQYGQGMNFTGMSPGFIPQQQQQQHQQQQQQHQFMTPPNSASMYNAPVMTAPAAFTSPAGLAAATGTAGIAYHSQMIGGQTTGFAQFPTGGGFPQSQFGMLAMSGATVQGQSNANNGALLSGNAIPNLMSNPSPGLVGLGMTMNMPMQVQPTAAASSVTASSNLNQQFGNLNIGNVWQ